MDLVRTADHVAESTTLQSLPRVRITRRSLLAAPPEEVWARIVSVRGVNAELMPIVHMTFPRACVRLDESDLTDGQPVFRSVLLLFGVLPVDVHTCAALTFASGRGFSERSSSLVHRVWLHRRELRAVPGGTKLTDHLDYECRLPGLAAVLWPVLLGVFNHRHRQLRRHFGVLPRTFSGRP